MKKLFTPLVGVFLALTSYSQTIYQNCQDGKIWFKVKDDVVLNRINTFKGQQSNLSTTQKCRLELGGLDDIFQNFTVEELKPFAVYTRSPKLSRTYELNFSNYQQVDQLIKVLEDQPQIEYAERVPLDRRTVTPNDPNYGPGSQWFLAQVNAEQAWNASLGNSNIVLAVVDDAVDIDHPDLSPVLWTNSGEIAGNGQDDDNNGYVDDVNGADVANGSGDPRPGSPVADFTHGTHVAGIAAAATDNGVGVASMGFGISLMSLRCADNSSSLTSTYQGVLYAIENGANVVNMSYGSSFHSNTYQNLIDWGYQNNVTMIAAAGNDDVNSVFYPAGYDHVIAVAATQGSDAKASFSNYDDGSGWIDISAPGTSILSTVPVAVGSYDYKQGTSMASPLVAGLAGLMLSLNDQLTPDDIETCLESNVDPVTGSYASFMGAGRINAEDAMNCVAATLAWAPSADFTANVTTISAGGTIDFTDLSQYNPTSWSWNFGGGGTPNTSSQQNPAGVLFNTPGTYTVTLTATNANGNDLETKTGYIQVNPTTGCDTTTHTLPNDTIYTRSWATASYLGGTNSNGVTAYCDYFQNIYPAGTYIQDIVVYFTQGATNTPGNTVTMSIWNDNAGEPGSVIFSQDVDMQEIEDNQTVPGNPNAFYPTVVELSAPFQITGDFYVGIEVSGAAAAGEEAAIAYTHDFNFDVSGRPNYSWMYLSASNTFGAPAGWYDFGTTLSGSPKYAMHMYLRTTSLPVTANLAANPTTVCEGESIGYDASGSVNGATYEWYVNGVTNGYSTATAPSFSYPVAGIYTTYLVASNSCGFYNIDSLDVTVNATPSVSVSATATTICPGGSADLTASGATSYTWTPAGSLNAGTGTTVTASPTSNTTYTVVGTDGSCSAAADVSIVVEQTPTADFNFTPSSNICYNQPVYFDGAVLSSNATLYSWTFPSGSPATSTNATEYVSFSADGTYTVELEVQNGCGDNDIITQTITVDDCDFLGVNDDVLEGATVFFRSDIENIVLDFEATMDVEIMVVNSVGQMIFKEKLNDAFGQRLIDMSDQAKGVYFVSLISEGSRHDFKFAK